MNGNKNNIVASMFGDKKMRTDKMNKDGELGLFPNQLLMVCAKPGGFFQI